MEPRAAVNVRSGARWLGLGLLAALAFFVVGDATRAQSTANVGIDPLGVLDLQVKPNAVVILDSSGSMRELASASSASGISNGELVGDNGVVPGYPDSKLWAAKKVLTQVVQNNQARVKFRFGQYSQANYDFGPDLNNRFYYATTNPEAASVAVNATGDGSSVPGIRRDPARDNITVNGVTYYYAIAGRFWNGEIISIRNNRVTPAVTKTNPARVTLNDQDASGNSTHTVSFEFVGVNWNRGAGGCGGFQEDYPLPDCGTIDQFTTGIGPFLAPELKIKPTGDPNAGDIDGYADGALGQPPASMPTPNGIRAVGATPIARSLSDVRSWFQGTLWPTLVAPKPRTFVVLVTDGDDQCERNDDLTSDKTTLDANALRAAYSAEQLHLRMNTDPASSVATYVVVLGSGDSLTRAQWIAWAGTWAGTSVPVNASGDAWSRPPTPAEVAACQAAGGCTNPFTAANTDELGRALQAAIDQGATSGEYAASPTVTESVWEYGSVVGVDPSDPLKRYNAFVPIVYQPTFDASNYNGKLSAWGSDSAGNVVFKWEAGSKLLSRVAIDPTNPVTFDGLRTAINRRIFTTARNGVFQGSLEAASPRDPVALWPPSTATTPVVAPIDDSPGLLDAALGIVGGGDATELQNLKTRFGACVGSPLPANCATTQPLATQIARARREAREMILAYTAGATTSIGQPARVQSGATAGEILYTRRGWLLGESTVAASAVVTPPLETQSEAHSTEYRLFRDGPRSSGTAVNGIAYGFGLRNPDKDGSTTSRPLLKPIMSVVYVPTNEMLHAFRAGPCLPGGPVPCNDTGGEELWGFVPFDQLGKLAGRMQPQTRDPHTYMLATSVRFADVFVPEAFNQSVGGVTINIPGRWRTLLFLGRGIGGKYLTALDVTVSGAATLSAWTTGCTSTPTNCSNAPKVMWSRGNPDTQDGTATGLANNPLTTVDGLAYGDMGQTWSTPSVVRVIAESAGNPTGNKTVRTPSGVEFVAYVGSGYGTGAGEGRRLYALDAVTGDVVGSYNVGDRSGSAFGNAIVAPPAALSPASFAFETFVHPSDALATRVYVGDVHGRLWSFPTLGGTQFAPLSGGAFADLGADQPIGNGVALLYYNSDGVASKAHVYVETGNDKRVAPPGTTPPFQQTPPFRMYGLRDDELTSDPDGGDGVNGPAHVLFTTALPNDPAPGYRGTTQPATAFNNQRKGRVFFVGTRLTPAGTECVSHFDSILYALTAIQGDAAFDLSNGGDDRFFEIHNQLVNQVEILRKPPESGQVSLSKALGASGQPPSPPRPPAPQNAAPPTRSDVYPLDFHLSSTVCR
jgi:hypothetical protein